jgi:hypothetical protein
MLTFELFREEKDQRLVRLVRFILGDCGWKHSQIRTVRESDVIEKLNDERSIS